MKKIIATLATTAILSACGGGSEVAPMPASLPGPPSTQAGPPVIATPEPLAVMPPVSSGAVRMSVRGLNQGGNGAEWTISFAAAVDMTVSGSSNKLWVAAATAGGSAAVSGTKNTIVFMPGTITTVSVSADGNIFYLAEGSPLKLEGTGAAGSTVKYYKP